MKSVKKTTKFSKKADLGDFLGVEGEVMRTDMGELSIKATHITHLSKALRPLPEKFTVWQTLKPSIVNVTLISNRESFERFVTRSKNHLWNPSLPWPKGSLKWKHLFSTTKLGRCCSSIYHSPQCTEHWHGASYRDRASLETSYRWGYGTCLWNWPYLP